jgi:hypothetical protein
MRGKSTTLSPASILSTPELPPPTASQAGFVQDSLKKPSLLPSWGLALGAAAIGIYGNVMDLRIGGVASFSVAVNAALLIATSLACKQANAWGAALVLWTSHCLFASPFTFRIIVPAMMLWAVLMIEPQRLYRHLREHLILICVLLFCYLGSELFYQGQRTSTSLESALAFFRLASIFIAVPAFARIVAKARDMQEGVVVSVALFSAYLLYIYLSSDRMVYGEDKTQEIDAAVGNLTITAMSTWLGPALACVACALFGQAFATPSLVRAIPCLTLAASALSVIMRVGARGATIAALAGMGIIAPLSFLRKGRLAHNVLVVVVVAAATCFFTFGSSKPMEAISKRFVEAQNNPHQVTARPDRWLLSLEQVCEAPMGTGYTVAPIGLASQAHNDLLIVSMSYGAAAGITVVVLFLAKLLRLLKATFSRRVRTQYAIAGLGLLATFGIASNLDMLLVVGFVFEWSWMVLCVLEEYSSDDTANAGF